jgi:hypothetical protein
VIEGGVWAPPVLREIQCEGEVVGDGASGQWQNKLALRLYRGLPRARRLSKMADVRLVTAVRGETYEPSDVRFVWRGG